MGQLIREELLRSLGDNSAVVEIRGKGLMLGIELDRDCPELVAKALERGLLINVTAGNTVRLLPPLTISRDEARILARGVAELISELNQSAPILQEE